MTTLETGGQAVAAPSGLGIDGGYRELSGSACHRKAGSAPYAVAGRATRRATAVAARARVAGELTELDLLTLLAVLSLTTSWSKLQDETTTRQVAALVYPDAEPSSGQRRRVGDSLTRLAETGAITLERSSGGRWSRLIIGVPSPSDAVVEPPPFMTSSRERDESASDSVNVFPQEQPTRSRGNTQRAPAAARSRYLGEENFTEGETARLAALLCECCLTHGYPPSRRSDLEAEGLGAVKRALAGGATSAEIADRIAQAQETGERWPSRILAAGARRAVGCPPPPSGAVWQPCETCGGLSGIAANDGGCTCGLGPAATERDRDRADSNTALTDPWPEVRSWAS